MGRARSHGAKNELDKATCMLGGTRRVICGDKVRGGRRKECGSWVEKSVRVSITMMGLANSGVGGPKIVVGGLRSAVVGVCGARVGWVGAGMGWAGLRID